MTGLALLIACVALIFSGIAYWRSGGRSDVEQAREEIRRELETLRTRQKALIEALTYRIQHGYEQSLQRIKRAQSRLQEMKDETVEGLQKRIDLAMQDLESLKQKAEQGIASVKGGMVEKAHQAEEAVARRVRRIEGRIQILSIKSAINRAQRFIEKQEFDQAEELLKEAVNELREARMYLPDYDPSLNTVLTTLREALKAVQMKAEDLRTKVEQVMKENEQLLSALEGAEQEEEKHHG